MSDVVSRYKSKKVHKKVSMILAALVVAMGINFLVLDNSMTQNIKTSVLESNQNKLKADLSLENKNGKIVLTTNKRLNNIKNLTISFSYNPQNVEIKDVVSSLNSSSDLFSNTPGISFVSINFPTSQSFELKEDILEINLSKKENISEQLNIINANFTDVNDETFEPTTSGVAF